MAKSLRSKKVAQHHNRQRERDGEKVRIRLEKVSQSLQQTIADSAPMAGTPTVDVNGKVSKKKLSKRKLKRKLQKSKTRGTLKL
ncbi:hypothetical protein P9112_008183 [Eukaryota sp. TZLM1-RC]